MGDVGVVHAEGEGRATAASAVRAPLCAADVAWLAALPCMAIVAAAIALLGPAMGDALLPRATITFWPSASGEVFPEPAEHARYLIALTAPLLLAGAMAIGVRSAVTAPRRTTELLVTAAQVVALAFVALCVVVQHRYVFREIGRGHIVYFTSVTLWVAAAIALAIGAALASDGVRRRLAALRPESRRARTLALAAGVLAIVVWVTPGVYTERTIINGHEAIVEHLPYWLDEVFAVLDGPFPLVGYSAQYGSLLPYPVAGAMALFGASIGSFTVAMSVATAGCMLAAFATLRRVARSSLAGLLLFLPFMATSFFMMQGPLVNRYATVNLFGTFPLRYAGPFVLLWLTARHLDGAAPRTPAWLFLAAGLTAMNNGDFGVPALGATVAALLWSRRPLELGRLAREIVLGLAGALVAVSALTLLTAGLLPDLGRLFRFAGVFALAGFGMLPMVPTIGMSTVIYLTYVAAIAVATVRVLDGRADRLMTGLLAWSGVFGLGIGSYYVGRSHPEVLTNMFAAWALTVTLLFVLSVRAVLARASHRPTVPEAACLLAFGVLVCSLTQTPTPWSQAQRLQDRGDKIYARPLGQPFIAEHTRPGESVAILTGLGHRAAYNLHIVDVTAYAGVGSMPTVDQLEEMLDELQAAGGTKVFMNAREGEWPEIPDNLVRSGYRIATAERFGMTEYVRAAEGRASQ